MCCLLEMQSFRRGDGHASLGQPWRERVTERGGQEKKGTGHGTRYGWGEEELAGVWRGEKQVPCSSDRKSQGCTAESRTAPGTLAL